MQLKCQNCGSDISAEDINVNLMIAKCTACNAVFSFADRFDIENVYQPYQKPQVDRPASMSVDHRGSDLIIVRKWFTPVFFFLLFFALFWNGITWTIVSAILLSRQWPMLLFLSLHICVGLGILYAALTNLLNSTEIRVDRQQIRIVHGPLPVLGNCTIPVHEINQIYCKQKISHTRNGVSITYEVYALTNGKEGQKRKALVTGLPNPEDALFLEQEIEKFLRIDDRPIAGEFRG
ncbi:MAG: hypothetical protein SFW36_07540 [Leptolyngbyaceae cyanobacterium bins.59]|nr:hypothetical protein [Leptolyngbyaceae cyanobacterium bins.59]